MTHIHTHKALSHEYSLATSSLEDRYVPDVPTSPDRLPILPFQARHTSKPVALLFFPSLAVKLAWATGERGICLSSHGKGQVGMHKHTSASHSILDWMAAANVFAEKLQWHTEHNNTSNNLLGTVAKVCNS